MKVSGISTRGNTVARKSTHRTVFRLYEATKREREREREGPFVIYPVTHGLHTRSRKGPRWLIPPRRGGGGGDRGTEDARLCQGTSHSLHHKV